VDQFTIVKKGGYDPEEVKKYISTLDMVIKSYKDKDNAIKNAIISANIAAENVLQNAKYQAEEYKSQIIRDLQKVRDEVSRQRSSIQIFTEIYGGLLKKYLQEIQNFEISDLFKRLDDVDNTLDILMQETAKPIPPVDLED
jgi:hypothetical protein